MIVLCLGSNSQHFVSVAAFCRFIGSEHIFQLIGVRCGRYVGEIQGIHFFAVFQHAGELLGEHLLLLRSHMQAGEAGDMGDCFFGNPSGLVAVCCHALQC